MPIKEILAQQSKWTWDIMLASAQLGEMIREDAITSVNLATINELAKEQGVPISITSFQGAKLEMEFGADWMWSYGTSGYLVQAKRLDVVPHTGDLSYTIKIQQLDLLVDASQTLSGQHGIDTKPAYVFYNSMMKDVNPLEWGCMFVNAMVLQNYLSQKIKPGQQTATLSTTFLFEYAEPWYKMFGSFK
ncbi:MAG: hypothetical protein AB1489_14785 [Acidobacteriota bacterium]